MTRHYYTRDELQKTLGMIGVNMSRKTMNNRKASGDRRYDEIHIGKYVTPFHSWDQFVSIFREMAKQDYTEEQIRELLEEAMKSDAFYEGRNKVIK